MAVSYREAKQLPPNFEAFAKEIGGQVGGIYGDFLGSYVSRSAKESYERILNHSGVRCFAANVDELTVGILILTWNGATAQVQVLHVLKAWEETAPAEALIAYAIGELAPRADCLITAELLKPLPDRSVFAAPWIRETYPRYFMSRDVNDGDSETTGSLEYGPISSASLPELARVLVEAFEGTGESRFQRNISNLEDAEILLTQILAGQYGQPVERSCLCFFNDDGLAGLVLTVESLPRAALISHLAVTPSARRNGIGKGLICAALDGLRELPVERAVLAVDGHNPARALYRSVGFRDACSAWGYRWERAKV